MPKSSATRPKSPGWRRRLLRWLLRGLLAFFGFAAVYGLAVWICGAIAVNSDWQQPENGIEIMVQSNGIHTDFYLPAKTDVIDWTTFAPLQSMPAHRRSSRYVLIGWGDRGFFLDTPTWDDMTIARTFSAVFLPTSTVMHVYYRYALPGEGPQRVKLRLRDDEYRRMVAYMQSGFRRGASNEPILIPDRSYSANDVFYEGVGTYHLGNTCNNWACRALDAAGVTTPLWSPFDGAIFAHLPK